MNSGLMMNNTGEMRLQKFLSSCGVASRRGAEDLIVSGRIKINGVVVDTLGFKVTGNEIIEFDGKRLSVYAKKYIVINKPEGYLCTRKDTHGRKDVFELLGDVDDPSIFHVGRLDMDSCGLLILTNDGDFANTLIHPSTSINKGYLVECDIPVSIRLTKAFASGLEVGDVHYKALRCELMEDESFVLVELKEGKKREIREVFKSFSYRILKLERIFIGAMELQSLHLKSGEFKLFNKEEITKLIYNGGENGCSS